MSDHRSYLIFRTYGTENAAQIMFYPYSVPNGTGVEAEDNSKARIAVLICNPLLHPSIRTRIPSTEYRSPITKAAGVILATVQTPQNDGIGKVHPCYQKSE